MGNTYPLLSPGVAFREFDFSQYAERLSSTIFGVVGRAAKGKVNDRIKVANPTELVNQLGYPNPSWKDRSWYSMEQYLKIGNQGVFVRVINLKVPNEVIGSGTGVQVHYSGTLVNHPLTPNTIDFSYPNAVHTPTPHHAYDNGLGRVIEDGNDIGSIDYQTGAYDVTFAYAPDSGSNNVLCSYSESGIAQAVVTDSGVNKILRISATSPGTWANTVASGGIRIQIRNVVTPGSGPCDDFDLAVQGWDVLSNAFADIEQYSGLSLIASSDNYIVKVINEGRRGDPISQNIVVEVLNNTYTLVDNNYSFALGDDGADLDAIDYAGTLASQTGVYAMANSKILDLNVVAVPGVQIDGTHVSVSGYKSIIDAMEDMCRNVRRDCFYLVDPPMGYNRQQVISWRKGNNGPAKDTSYGALYWPWIISDDPYNNVNVILPPSGFVAQRYAYNDQVAAAWFAPAGLNRGVLNPQPLGLQFTPTDADVDALYDRKVNVNTILPDPSAGFVVWGQRTLQNRPTKLDRVNVRRMLLYLEKVISTSVKYLVFEPDDELTWTTFIHLVTPYVEEVKNGRGLDDVKVICDKTTNTDIAKDRSEMYGKILLKPTPTAEYIIIDFNLYNSGGNFSA